MLLIPITSNKKTLVTFQKKKNGSTFELLRYRFSKRHTKFQFLLGRNGVLSGLEASSHSLELEMRPDIRCGVCSTYLAMLVFPDSAGRNPGRARVVFLGGVLFSFFRQIFPRLYSYVYIDIHLRY